MVVIIYNVTIKTDSAITEDWLLWMKEIHIPEVIYTGCFTHATILRLLEIDETEGPTFAIQYHATSKAFYNQYMEQFAADMRKKVQEKWGSQLVAFRTVMQVVN